MMDKWKTINVHSLWVRFPSLLLERKIALLPYLLKKTIVKKTIGFTFYKFIFIMFNVDDKITFKIKVNNELASLKEGLTILESLFKELGF